MQFFYAPNACSLASHIALEEAGADYELVRVDLKGGEQNEAAYRAINPKGRVPALATDQGVLTENTAILGYIARTWPSAPLADNKDAFAFAAVQAFNSFLASSVHVTFAHRYRPYRYAADESAYATMAAKVPEALADYFGVIEKELEGSWVRGESYTTADPYLYVFTRWLKRDGLGDPAKFPRVLAHAERMEERPAVRRTLEREGLS